MNKTLTFLVITLFFIGCNKNNNPTPELVFEGNITLYSQDDIDAFGENNYTRVNGNLIIDERTQITSLGKLSTISSVGGNLIILRCSALRNLEGLSNLISIGENLSIIDNHSLSSLNGLNKLTTIVEDLTVRGNIVLPNINSLSSLIKVDGAIFISHNDVLQNIDGLENTSMNGLLLQTNKSMNDIAAIGHITSFSIGLVIRDLDALTSLEDLSNVKTVGILELFHNDAITNLNGLTGLINVEGALIIESNFSLTNFCDIQNLISTSSVGSYTVKDNIFNPSEQDIKDGNCSQ